MRMPNGHILRVGWTDNSARGRYVLVLACLLFAVLSPARTGAQKRDSRNASPSGPIVVAAIDGPIMPPTRNYYERALRRAEREKAACLLVEMDTPGGRSDTMREIAQLNLTAQVPVVVYITPPGARAGSAGAVIALSAHILAMSPGTNIGAAHPVMGNGGDIDKDMRDKVTNDFAAFARSLARHRGKNEKWAEDIVRHSISSTETEALNLKIADLIARDRVDLIKQLDGRKVKLPAGEQILATHDAKTVEEPQSWGESFLHFLFDPNVALICWMLAIYGLIAELNHPGAILPGVVGAISLVLALFSMSVLSVNATGVALLILSVVLFIIDLYATTHGVLTAGGLIAFVAGALMLFNPASLGVTVSLPLVIALAILTALFFGVIVGAAIRIRRQPPGTGPETLLGKTGTAQTPLEPTGRVFADGAIWKAVNEGTEPVQKGDTIVIVGREGLTLRVRRSAPAPAEPIWSEKHEEGIGAEASDVS